MNLVLTVCQGDNYKELAELTHPSIKAYADKISADFLIIDKQKISHSTPHWEKFQIFNLLEKYERIIFLDSDIIIRKDCPNLFDIVPENMLGIFNESPFTERSKELMIEICKGYGVILPSWNGKYFNTGVMVISRIHKFLFKKPEKEINTWFWEQSYLNMKIAQKDIDVYELSYKFNRMTCMDRYIGEHRLNSYIVHYAGCPNINFIKTLIPDDLKKWNDNLWNKDQHIYVAVTGGIGDQICAEPSLRFMQKYIYPEAQITVATHWPELFKHLNHTIHVIEHGKFEPENDQPYYLAQSLPGPDTVNWYVVSNLMSHTVDYCSMALLKRILPVKDKEIKLTVKETDIEYLKSMIHNDLKSLIVIHPGRHWQSKTLPTDYWQEIVDKLSMTNKICIVGQNCESTRGTVDIKCPENAIDLRDKTTLNQLIALISQAKTLVSNDSAPIHIAGAFDNNIVLIPTCKHPEHVLPYRKGSVYYKAKALYKELAANEFDSKPTCVCGSSGAELVKDWKEYLLPVNKVIEEIIELNH